MIGLLRGHMVHRLLVVGGEETQVQRYYQLLVEMYLFEDVLRLEEYFLEVMHAGYLNG